MYGLCMTIYGPTFICGKFGTFTSASVFEHAHLGSAGFNFDNTFLVLLLKLAYFQMLTHHDIFFAHFG